MIIVWVIQNATSKKFARCWLQPNGTIWLLYFILLTLVGTTLQVINWKLIQRISNLKSSFFCETQGYALGHLTDGWWQFWAAHLFMAERGKEYYVLTSAIMIFTEWYWYYKIRQEAGMLLYKLRYEDTHNFVLKQIFWRPSIGEIVNEPVSTRRMKYGFIEWSNL